MDVREQNYPSRYALADPAFDKRGMVDLLCNVELANELTTDKRLKEGSLTRNESCIHTGFATFCRWECGSAQLVIKDKADKVLQTNWVSRESDLMISRF